MTTRCPWTASPIGCPRPQPRQPAASMGRRPCPHYVRTTVCAAAAPRRWVGGLNGISAKLPPENGLGAEAPSQIHPTPTGAPAQEGGVRLTTRPDREPGLTGPSP